MKILQWKEWVEKRMSSNEEPRWVNSLLELDCFSTAAAAIPSLDEWNHRLQQVEMKHNWWREWRRKQNTLLIEMYYNKNSTWEINRIKSLIESACTINDWLRKQCQQLSRLFQHIRHYTKHWKRATNSNFLDPNEHSYPAEQRRRKPNYLKGFLMQAAALSWCGTERQQVWKMMKNTEEVTRFDLWHKKKEVIQVEIYSEIGITGK